MPTPTIADAPKGGTRLSWPSGEEPEVAVPCTLRAAADDYTALTLTIWRDPEWPREFTAVKDAERADPDADGWPVAVGPVTGAWSEDEDDTALFELTVPSGAGNNRYALKVTAERNGKAVVLVKTVWLTVTA